MKGPIRAIWYRREACAWVLLFSTVAVLQARGQGVIPTGPSPPSMDGAIIVPSWPPTTHPTTTTDTRTTSRPPSSTTPSTTGADGPGHGTSPEVPPGQAPPTTTTLPAATTTTTTTLATTTTKLCNRPGQPSPSTLRNQKPVDSRQVDHRVVCVPD